MTTRNIVIIVGKSAAGKTTLCKLLAEYIYKYVSASDVLRHTVGNLNLRHDRRSLAEQGNSVRGTPILTKFHDALLQKIDQTTGDIVLDGPRFAETVEVIRSSASHSLLVYLDCPDSVRLQRLNSDGRSSDWTWLAQHPTETSVTEMRDMADIVLDGTQPSQDLLEILNNELKFFSI